MRLQDVLDGRNVHDKPSVATGDVNTKDGDQNQDCERVMGEHRLKERNGNDVNEVVITGTLFPHKTTHKATWISADRKSKNQKDYVLIGKRFRNSVKDTRVYRSAGI